MVNVNPDTEIVTTALSDAGDAVGIDERKWFVAIVNHNTEKAVQERLTQQHYESYVAKQSVLRVWKNGKRANVDKVVIPSMVFIKCTEKERRVIVALPYINRFMTNKAATSANHFSKPLAIIPEKQIETLRFMLGQSEVPISFVESPLKVHDKVKVVRGDLRGIEGEVIRTVNGKSDVVVRIELLGSAKMTIDIVDLELVKL